MSIIHNMFAGRAVKVSDIRNPDLWLTNSLGGTATLSGETVDCDAALSLPAYFACIRCISEDIAKLPLFVYKRLNPKGKEKAPDHPLYPLLHDSPHPLMTSMSFREALLHNAMAWGNGYARIFTKGDGNEVTELWILHPTQVDPKWADNEEDVVYQVRYLNGSIEEYPANQIIHVHGLGYDGLVGYSVLQYAAESIGLGLAGQKFGSAFFGNAARPSGVLQHPGKMSDDAYKRLREDWTAKHTGSANAAKPAILEEGIEWKQLTIPNTDCQFLESRQFQVEEICRWFRMPPHKIAHLLRATYSNIEHQSQEYYTDTLLPWIVRCEQEYQRKLLNADSEYFAEHLVTGILRGDSKARSEYYKDLFMVGALSQNDIRDLENQNPIDGGDTYYVPMNMVRSEDASQGLTMQEPDIQQGDNNQQVQKEEKDSVVTGNLKDAYLDIFKVTAERILRKEVKAALRSARKYAGDKDAFRLWLEKFYAEHLNATVETFEPMVMSFLKAIGAETEILSRLNQFISLEINISVQSLKQAYERDNVKAQTEEWLQFRPAAIARKLMGEVENAIWT